MLVEDVEKYRSIELLFHLPIYIMSPFDIPALNTKFTAPRRKEYPVNPLGLIPARSNAWVIYEGPNCDRTNCRNRKREVQSQVEGSV